MTWNFITGQSEGSIPERSEIVLEKAQSVCRKGNEKTMYSYPDPNVKCFLVVYVLLPVQLLLGAREEKAIHPCRTHIHTKEA